MDEIRVLDSQIFNRIAAGEVVENPKSVIKELVENSIDANANKITIEIENGGIELIKVVDNGKGILSMNIKTAFLPHATSKIVKIEDLDAIATLGFRGEALPSIASVSTITMISRKSDVEMGYMIKYRTGVLIDEGDVGCPQGTTVLVENLFENIPARSKFLKKPSQEEAEVSDLIIKIILANPKLSIKYIVNGELKYHSSGDGVSSAIFSIYGKDVLDNLISVNDATSHITLHGYVSKPSYSKHNRNYQTLIVNGRYVINQDLSFCIGQCYQEFLMKRQFPMYVIYLDIPLDMVDVNIQPNKMNVKFVDFARVKGIIYNVIKNIIEKETKIPKNINTFMSTFSPVESYSLAEYSLADPSSLVEHSHAESYSPAECPHAESSIFPNSENASIMQGEKNFDMHNDSIFENTSILKENSFKNFNSFTFSDNENAKLGSESKVLDFNLTKTYLREPHNSINDNTQDIYNSKEKIDFSNYDNGINYKKNCSDKNIMDFNNNINKGVTGEDNPNSVAYFKEAKNNLTQLEYQTNDNSRIDSFYSCDEFVIIGKLFNTYIVVQKHDEILFIDQHAAHEKIIYDKMLDSIDTSKIVIQDLLIPYDFEISNYEKNSLNDIISIISELGFTIKSLDDLVYSITAIPALLSQLDFKDFVSSLVSLIDGDNNIKSSMFIKNKLMQSACKAAVKGEMDLSRNEIDCLLKDMVKSNVSLFCPHGRPIVVTLARSEIEKWFKRIV